MFEVKISPSIDKGKISLRTSGEFEFIGRSRVNNGIQGYTNKLSYEPNKSKTFSVSQVGTIVAQFRQKRWYSSQNIFILSVKHDTEIINNWLYILSSLNKALQRFDGGYSNYPTKSSLSNLQLTLPIKSDGTIAFDYMEAYIKELEAERIKELEAYLIATGLNDYALTEDEQRAIDKFRNGEIRWGEFAYKDIFDHIVQGSRLKKNDQFDGDLPFVMSGTTNTGIVRYIGNSVRVFPRNSLTVDIFGSVFYRNYDYGMGDDTGAFWNENKEISKFSMLYIGSTVAKSLLGKFDYGHKLRSSRTLDFKIKLPVIDNQPDYKYMNLYISAIEKLVIRGVVEWKDKQIEATKSVINEK